MTREVIDVGVNANDGLGDSLYEAGQKINSNFTELFAKPNVGADIKFIGNNIEASNSNADIDIHPAGTGTVLFPAIRFNANNIEVLNTNDDLKIIPAGSGKVTIAGLGFSGATISSDDSSSVNINENLVVDGDYTTSDGFTFSGAQTFASGMAIGNLTMANGSITDSSGAISFGNENLTTTGTLNAGDDSVIGNLTLTDGSITDSSGAISFGNENLSTTGTLDVSGTTTMGSISVSGATSFADSITVDNLTFNDNIISTSSNADLRLTPGGTGVVNVSNLTIDSSLNFTDNVLKVTTSNADLDLDGSGTGSVNINKIGLSQGTIDNTVIGASTPAAGTFTAPINYNTLVFDKVTFSGNTLSAKRSNDNLEFEASGSGKVIVNDFSLPNSDGDTGAFLQTDGSKGLSFFVSSISFSESTIVDNQETIGFTSKTLIDANTATGRHEQLIATPVVIDEFTTSKYDSAWYLVLSRNKAADSAIEFQIQKHTMAQGTEDGSTFDTFSGSSQIVRTSDNDAAPLLDTDIRSAVNNVRLTGRAGLLADSSVSTDNAVSFFRIGLGDNDSSGSQAASGLASTIVVADLDSAVSNLDTFSISSARAAKYFISINNTTTNEVSSTEVLLTHDGTDAFVMEYNMINSNGGNTPLATFTADISGGNARLRGANGTAGTCRVTMYRILISDSESSSDGTYVDVIGAQNITNIGQTTIDTNTFRGDAAPDVSSQKTISSFANTFDSVWFHTIHKDITNSEFAMHKYSTNDGITSDGSTRQVGITDSSVLNTGAMNDINLVDVAINGSNIDLKATGQSDGSTSIKNATSYFALGLGDNTTTATSGNIKTHAGVTFGGNNETRVDTLTSTGTTTSILNTQRTLATFDKTAYDSAWYLGVSNDIENSGLATFKYSVMHNDSSAFITSSSITRTDLSHNHLETDADVSGSNVRLLGNGGRLDDSSKSNSNTIAYYRIGLGDNDSSAYESDDGVADTDVVTVGGIQETTVDHVVATGTHATLSSTGTTTCAEFTAGQFDSALYLVVNHDVANGSFETQKISICHNLQDSFMTSSSIVSTDEGDTHPIYTTDVVTSGDSTSKVRLRSTDSDGSTVSANNTMAYYRIGLGDSDSTGYVGELGLVNDIMHVDIIGSSSVVLDAMTKTAHVGAKYFISVVNQATGESGNIEALITHDNTTGYVISYNEFFSGNNSLITLTADVSSNTLSLRGSATAGDSTKVIVHRVVAFGDSESTEANSDSTRKVIGNVITSSTATTFDTFQSSDTDAVHYVITGQGGTNENYICEATVVTDGTNVFVSHGPSITTKTGEIELLEISATISGGTVSVKAASTSGATAVQAYAVRLKAPTNSTSTIDSFSISDFRGAKYFLSLNNLDSNEVSNIECLVVHDGTNAFINQYNEHFSGSASLLNGDLTADISGGNLRLRCVVASDNTRVTFYRVILSDEPSTQTFTNTKLIGGVTASSTATTVDTFNDTSIDGAHYVIIGTNSSEGAASIQEANVITDGTGAFVSSGPFVSSKETNQLDLTAEHDGSNTVTLKASSTSGASTKVAAYRVQMQAPTGQTDNLDTFAKGSFRGAKYYVSAKETVTGYISNMEAMVVHDGTNSFITVFNEHFSHVSLVTLTTDISGSDVRLRCAGNIPDVKVKFYRVLLADNESGSTGTDFNTVAASTVSSTATAIDTFEDTSHTGANYIIVSRNSGESTAQIMEATVLSNGREAFVHEGPHVSSKGTPQLSLTAEHNGSTTVTLKASSTSGSSTTVNAFRIHMLRTDRDAFTTLDTFAHADEQAANYIIAMKDADNRVQLSDVMLVSDGTDAYHTEIDVNSESATAPFITITSAVNGSNVELRAESTIEQSTTITNIFKIPLNRPTGNPQSVATLDTFDKTTHRSAAYFITISDSNTGTLGNYETLEARVTHDGSNSYISTFGRTNSATTGDLVTFTTDVSGDDVRLRGAISSTNAHKVTVVRRLINL